MFRQIRSTLLLIQALLIMTGDRHRFLPRRTPTLCHFVLPMRRRQSVYGLIFKSHDLSKKILIAEALEHEAGVALMGLCPRQAHQHNSRQVAICALHPQRVATANLDGLKGILTGRERLLSNIKVEWDV